MAGKKLPIAETAVEAVMFGFRSLVDAVRVGWLWIALYVAATLGIERWQADTLESLDGLGPMPGAEEIMPLLPELLAYSAVSILSVFLLMPLLVLFARVAAGDEAAPKGIFHGRWGHLETRATLVAIAYSVLCGALGVLIFSGAVAAIGALGIMESWMAIGVVGLGGLLFGWITLRFGLVGASSMIEERWSLRHALRATSGQVLPLFASLLLLSLLLILTLLGGGVMMAALGAMATGGAAVAGTETMTGRIFEGIATGAGYVFTALSTAVPMLAGVGWGGKAWAALR